MTRRLVRIAWLAVLVASALMALDTGAVILQIGLTGSRPPLSAFQTGLRIVLVVGALGLLYWRRHPLERATLTIGAAAAGSSMLYGFGMRSPALSAFRLLSHLVMYICGIAVAWRLAERRARNIRPRPPHTGEGQLAPSPQP
jgi:hypothetical protein